MEGRKKTESNQNKLLAKHNLGSCHLPSSLRGRRNTRYLLSLHALHRGRSSRHESKGL